MDLIVDPTDIVQCRAALRGGTEITVQDSSIDLWNIEGGALPKKKKKSNTRKAKHSKKKKILKKSSRGLLAGSRLWRVRSLKRARRSRNKRKLHEMRRSRSRVYRSYRRRRSA